MTWQRGDSVEATWRRGVRIEIPEFVLDLIAWVVLVVVCILCNLASEYVITFDLGLTYICGTKKKDAGILTTYVR